MKKLSVLFVLTLSVIIAQARTFEIKVLNTPTINIGGKLLMVGDSFQEKAPIVWTSDNQAMKVLSDDNKVYVLSKNLLGKHKAKSFADYITSVRSATVRNDGENFPITVADHRAIFENDFVLLDTICLKVGWRTSDSSYFEATTTNLGDQDFSFIIPAQDDLLIINREILLRLSLDCPRLIISINYVEKEYEETTPVTDSMNIEIVPLEVIKR